MKLLAVAILVLAAAVGFTGAVLLTRDHGTKTVTVAAPQPSVSADARTFAAIEGIDPVVAQERIRIANDTCDVLKLVGEKPLWSVCTFNIEHGDPWWDSMPPRQLRAMAQALSHRRKPVARVS
jgi:hypothetical protein